MQIYGLEVSKKEAQVILIPVPWEVTASYGSGTSKGPDLINQASVQVDLYDLEVKNAYECGYFMLPIDNKLKIQNKKLRTQALKINKKLQNLEDLTALDLKTQKTINMACKEMNDYVYRNSKEILKEKKVLGVLGGDHSVPLGAIKALSEEYTEYGILHIDAHLDLRDQYAGFENSHASIMNNVMRLKNSPKKIVQYGIRDFCEEEVNFMNEHKNVFSTQYDLDIKKALLAGQNFPDLSRKALKTLPDNVYISFDIDGLDPTLCPNTGTPVPGGLSYEQVLNLFSTLHDLGKKIIGFDLVEVSGGPTNYEWNGNVGARLLFKLCGWAAISQGKYQI